jgi:hypothetical protein
MADVILDSEVEDVIEIPRQLVAIPVAILGECGPSGGAGWTSEGGRDDAVGP